MRDAVAELLAIYEQSVVLGHFSQVQIQMLRQPRRQLHRRVVPANTAVVRIALLFPARTYLDRHPAQRAGIARVPAPAHTLIARIGGKLPVRREVQLDTRWRWR